MGPAVVWRHHQAGELQWFSAAGSGWTAVFSTRHGGVSSDPFSSLNTSLTVGDDEEHVLQNRARLGSACGFRAHELVLGQQTHSTKTAWVDARQSGRGARAQADALSETDGLMTDVPHLPLAVGVADCVPVVIGAMDAGGRAAVAVVHAGWRGMLGGIVEAAARRLKEHGELTEAVVGPSIGPCCFVVGADVAQAFADRYGATVGQDHVDLWSAAAQQLVAAGVAPHRMLVSRLCTACDRRFYSYRREAGRTGRQLAVAWVSSTSGEAEPVVSA